jgi:cytidine deaminase
VTEFDWSPLVERAREASRFAHAPYSNFHVGAAVLDDEGRVYVGCNIESASFGLTMCAERVALFTARAAGACTLVRLAVVCMDARAGTGIDGRMPCGACRQVMSELLSPNAEIYIEGVGVRRIRELLPDAFRLET